MLEIVALIGLTRHLAGVAAGKGYPKLVAAIVPVLWLGMEFAGAVVAGCAGLGDLALYGVALLSAAFGAAMAYGVVWMLPGRVPDADAVGRDPDEIRDNPFA